MEFSWKRRIIQTVAALSLLGVVIYIVVHYGAVITAVVNNPARLRSFLAAYGELSVLVFILLQTLMVILAPIPSELLFITGGYLYGTLLGTVYSLIGVALGMMIVFWLSATFGAGLIRIAIPAKQFERFHFLINHPKAERVLFLLFLIPEIPKDILTYIVGLTPLNPVRFLALALTARIPCMLGSSYIGENIKQRQFGPALYILIIVVILLLLLFVFKERLLRKLAGQDLDESAATVTANINIPNRSVDPE